MREGDGPVETTPLTCDIGAMKHIIVPFSPKQSRRPLYSVDDASLRSAYLSLLGLIFLVAFSSYHAQYPGLLSSSGIDPSERILRVAFPGLYRKIVEEGWIDADSLCELTCVAGASLAAAVARCVGNAPREGLSGARGRRQRLPTRLDPLDVCGSNRTGDTQPHGAVRIAPTGLAGARE